jgi:hypothetical protein
VRLESAALLLSCERSHGGGHYHYRRDAGAGYRALTLSFAHPDVAELTIELVTQEWSPSAGADDRSAA